jgi:hypothetical protein
MKFLLACKTPDGGGNQAVSRPKFSVAGQEEYHAFHDRNPSALWLKKEISKWRLLHLGLSTMETSLPLLLTGDFAALRSRQSSIFCKEIDRTYESTAAAAAA